MSAGEFGCIVTPGEGRYPPPGSTWLADNSKYGRSYPGDARWYAWLERLAPRAADCWGAVAPDVPFDGAGTLALSPRFFPLIRGLGLPAALAAQDGMEDMAIPWDGFDVLAIGGTTEWKLGTAASWLAREAADRGKHVHMLRGNSERACRHAFGIGARSLDGTFFARAPDINLARARRWLARIEATGVQGKI